MSAGIKHLEVIGISKAELISYSAWSALKPKQFDISLITSSYPLMKSSLRFEDSRLMYEAPLDARGN